MYINISIFQFGFLFFSQMIYCFWFISDINLLIQPDVLKKPKLGDNTKTQYTQLMLCNSQSCQNILSVRIKIFTNSEELPNFSTMLGYKHKPDSPWEILAAGFCEAPGLVTKRYSFHLCSALAGGASSAEPSTSSFQPLTEGAAHQN